MFFSLGCFFYISYKLCFTVGRLDFTEVRMKNTCPPWNAWKLPNTLLKNKILLFINYTFPSSHLVPSSTYVGSSPSPHVKRGVLKSNKKQCLRCSVKIDMKFHVQNGHLHAYTKKIFKVTRNNSCMNFDYSIWKVNFDAWMSLLPQRAAALIYYIDKGAEISIFTFTNTHLASIMKV